MMSSNPFETCCDPRRHPPLGRDRDRRRSGRIRSTSCADLVAAGYRDLPATVERIAGRDGCGDHLVARSSWGRLRRESWC